MSQSEQKIVQYLNEAHATEVGSGARAAVPDRHGAWVPIARGSRSTFARRGTRRARAGAAGRDRASGNPLQAGIGFLEGVLSQTLALWKMPLDLVRGGSGEEKVLKNAKDACATEALEIATYTALEHLARAIGDDDTAELAASIRADEERMLDRVVGELPKLARAVVRPRSTATRPTRSPSRRGGRRARDGPASKARQRDGRRQAHGSPDPQGAGRGASRGTGQGARRVGRGSGDPGLRRAHRRGDREQAGRALADRAGQGRGLRAQARRPLDGPDPDQRARRATSRGPATTSSRSTRPCGHRRRDDERAERRAHATSARTRTAPAC